MATPDPVQMKLAIQQTFDLVASGYETPTMRYFPFRADQNEAGFSQTRVEKKQMAYHLAGNLDWWEILYNSALRGLLEQLVPPQLADFRIKHLAGIDKLKTDKRDLDGCGSHFQFWTTPRVGITTLF